MTGHYLTADQDRVRTQLGRRTFRLAHQLCDHPLFELDRLAQLAQELPSALVEWNAGSVGESQDPLLTPSNGLSPEETVRRIADCQSWLVLKRIEASPDYAALLKDCVADLGHGLEQTELVPFRVRGFLFVSSPGAVTPLHLDPEQGVLLQIRGTKSVTVFAREDRAIVTDPELERFASGGHRNILRAPEEGQEPGVHLLEPGDGLHIPFHAPHLVKNGPEVSISFSLTFQTKQTDREHSVLMVNHRLRRLGLRPGPFGKSVRRDGAKHLLVQSAKTLRNWIRS